MNFIDCMNVALKKIGFNFEVDYDGDLNELDSTNSLTVSLDKRTNVDIKGDQRCKEQVLDPLTNALEMGGLVGLSLCVSIFMINSLLCAKKENDKSDVLLSSTVNPMAAEEESEESEEDDRQLLRMV